MLGFLHLLLFSAGVSSICLFSTVATTAERIVWLAPFLVGMLVFLSCMLAYVTRATDIFRHAPRHGCQDCHLEAAFVEVERSGL